jgi:hypothetical protein
MLTEILAALVLLALGLAQLFTSVGVASHAVSLSDGQRDALVVARSVLTEAGRAGALADGVNEGKSGDEHWRLVLKRPPDSAAGRDVLEGHDAELTISWHEDGRTRSLSFSTLLLTVPKP